jgi:hypothetical protein
VKLFRGLPSTCSREVVLQLLGEVVPERHRIDTEQSPLEGVDRFRVLALPQLPLPITNGAPCLFAATVHVEAHGREEACHGRQGDDQKHRAAQQTRPATDSSNVSQLVASDKGVLICGKCVVLATIILEREQRRRAKV